LERGDCCSSGEVAAAGADWVASEDAGGSAADAGGLNDSK